MTPDNTPIPVPQWHRDHWSTFCYAGHVAISNNPSPDRDKMRAKPGNPLKGHIMALASIGETGPWKYPTKLRDGTTLIEHDDWDCIEDIIAAGLLVDHGSGMHPHWELTALGRGVWAYIAASRKTTAAMDTLTVEEIRANVAGLPDGWPS